MDRITNALEQERRREIVLTREATDKAHEGINAIAPVLNSACADIAADPETRQKESYATIPEDVQVQLKQRSGVCIRNCTGLSTLCEGCWRSTGYCMRAARRWQKLTASERNLKNGTSLAFPDNSRAGVWLPAPAFLVHSLVNEAYAVENERRYALGDRFRMTGHQPGKSTRRNDDSLFPFTLPHFSLDSLHHPFESIDGSVEDSCLHA